MTIDKELQIEIDKANAVSVAVYALRQLAPNIVDVSEGSPNPAKRRASVRLEFYGPDATAKSIEASTAIRAILVGTLNRNSLAGWSPGTGDGEDD